MKKILTAYPLQFHLHKEFSLLKQYDYIFLRGFMPHM